MNPDSGLTPEIVLDSINEGVYAVDATRKIVYWSQSAERITGWPAEAILGKHCFDEVLCHIDKDGHRLCGEEHCPLHRSMVTGKSSEVGIIVFAQTKSGGRVPLQVAVAPLRGADGQVIGGVETFRDLSSEIGDINRARRIQMLAMQAELPADPRVRFTARYVPQDVIGGDYCAVARLDADRFGFLLADVMGHGVPAALYTMYLSSLWVSHQHLISRPTEFAQAVNDRLRLLTGEDESFAAAVCGVFDLAKGELRIVGCGGPPPLLVRDGGQWEYPEVSGLPLGMMEGITYDEAVLPIGRGDCVLLFTDGAVEITDPTGGSLGVHGLSRILQEVGYPGAGSDFEAIETRMLATSDRIRFDDDVTFLDVRIGS
jgi:phosphoserine phosphatase RsbU/P